MAMRTTLDSKKIEIFANIVRGMNIRYAYELLAELRNAEPEMIVAIKRYVRKASKEKEYPYQIVRGEQDGVVYKTVLDADTAEEAEQEFRCKHHREYWPTYYDCTGQWFTYWHRIFKINGKYVLYHSIQCDC